jgi:hypothetical protein
MRNRAKLEPRNRAKSAARNNVEQRRGSDVEATWKRRGRAALSAPRKALESVRASAPVVAFPVREKFRSHIHSCRAPFRGHQHEPQDPPCRILHIVSPPVWCMLPTPKTHGLLHLGGIIRTAGYRHNWMHKCSSWNISANVPTGTLSHFARTARSIRRLARRVTSLRASRRPFLDQPIKFGAGLPDQRRGKRPRRPLPFRRQILHPHVQQWNVLLKQSQSFLYAGNAVISRKHGKWFSGIQPACHVHDQTQVTN